MSACRRQNKSNPLGQIYFGVAFKHQRLLESTGYIPPAEVRQISIGYSPLGLTRRRLS